MESHISSLQLPINPLDKNTPNNSWIMEIIKFSPDLEIHILKKGRICTIDIINPDWQWMSKYLSGSTTIQMEWNILIKTDELFWRNLIEKTYKENKKFIFESKMKRFRSY